MAKTERSARRALAHGVAVATAADASTIYPIGSPPETAKEGTADISEAEADDLAGTLRSVYLSLARVDRVQAQRLASLLKIVAAMSRAQVRPEAFAKDLGYATPTELKRIVSKKMTLAWSVLQGKNATGVNTGDIRDVISFLNRNATSRSSSEQLIASAMNHAKPIVRSLADHHELLAQVGIAWPRHTAGPNGGGRSKLLAELLTRIGIETTPAGVRRHEQRLSGKA